MDAIIFLAWVWLVLLSPLSLTRSLPRPSTYINTDHRRILNLSALFWRGLVSPFDEKLSEDRRVNRLEDSYLLWKSVCSCKLLARTQIILCKFSDVHDRTISFSLSRSVWQRANSNYFLIVLNKCDLLQAKLQRGIRIRDSVPSFGDRKNDLSTATRCEHFFQYLFLIVCGSASLNYGHLRFFFFDQTFNNISRR